YERHGAQLKSSRSRGPGGNPLRPVPGVPPTRAGGKRLGQRSWRGIVAFTHLAREGRMTVIIERRGIVVARGGAAAAGARVGRGAAGGGGAARRADAPHRRAHAPEKLRRIEVPPQLCRAAPTMRGLRPLARVEATCTGIGISPG